MNKISVTIITFNEEKNIRRCLESVKWADEIVVVDSYSTDNTVDICKEYTDRIIKRQWNSYSDQKNFAIDSAKYDWIFSIDADEEVSAKLETEIMNFKRDFSHKGYKISRKVFYLGKWIQYGGWYPDYKLRLFNRNYGRWQGVDIHEEINLSGNWGKLQGDIFHFSYENLAAHIKQINAFTSIAAKQLFNEHKKPSFSNIFLNPILKFFKTFFLKRGFLDGKVGLYIALFGSFYVFLKYVKLWEIYMSCDEKPE